MQQATATQDKPRYEMTPTRPNEKVGCEETIPAEHGREAVCESLTPATLTTQQQILLFRRKMYLMSLLLVIVLLIALVALVLAVISMTDTSSSQSTVAQPPGTLLFKGGRVGSVSVPVYKSRPYFKAPNSIS